MPDKRDLKRLQAIARQKKRLVLLQQRLLTDATLPSMKPLSSRRKTDLKATAKISRPLHTSAKSCLDTSFKNSATISISSNVSSMSKEHSDKCNARHHRSLSQDPSQRAPKRPQVSSITSPETMSKKLRKVVSRDSSPDIRKSLLTRMSDAASTKSRDSSPTFFIKSRDASPKPTSKSRDASSKSTSKPRDASPKSKSKVRDASPKTNSKVRDASPKSNLKTREASPNSEFTDRCPKVNSKSRDLSPNVQIIQSSQSKEDPKICKSTDQLSASHSRTVSPNTRRKCESKTEITFEKLDEFNLPIGVKPMEHEGVHSVKPQIMSTNALKLSEANVKGSLSDKETLVLVKPSIPDSGTTTALLNIDIEEHIVSNRGRKKKLKRLVHPVKKTDNSMHRGRPKGSKNRTWIQQPQVRDRLRGAESRVKSRSTVAKKGKKTKKRTLSGEFNLVDERQLKKEMKKDTNSAVCESLETEITDIVDETCEQLPCDEDSESFIVEGIVLESDTLSEAQPQTSTETQCDFPDTSSDEITEKIKESRDIDTIDTSYATDAPVAKPSEIESIPNTASEKINTLKTPTIHTVTKILVNPCRETTPLQVLTTTKKDFGKSELDDQIGLNIFNSNQTNKIDINDETKLVPLNNPSPFQSDINLTSSCDEDVLQFNPVSDKNVSKALLKKKKKRDVFTYKHKRFNKKKKRKTDLKIPLTTMVQPCNTNISPLDDNSDIPVLSPTATSSRPIEELPCPLLNMPILMKEQFESSNAPPPVQKRKPGRPRIHPPKIPSGRSPGRPRLFKPPKIKAVDQFNTTDSELITDLKQTKISLHNIAIVNIKQITNTVNKVLDHSMDFVKIKTEAGLKVMVSDDNKTIDEIVSEILNNVVNTVSGTEQTVLPCTENEFDSKETILKSPVFPLKKYKSKGRKAYKKKRQAQNIQNKLKPLSVIKTKPTSLRWKLDHSKSGSVEGSTKLVFKRRKQFYKSMSERENSLFLAGVEELLKEKEKNRPEFPSRSRQFMLREKISRSPLEILAMKDKLEEEEYEKSILPKRKYTKPKPKQEASLETPELKLTGLPEEMLSYCKPCYIPVINIVSLVKEHMTIDIAEADEMSSDCDIADDSDYVLSEGEQLNDNTIEKNKPALKVTVTEESSQVEQIENFKDEGYIGSFVEFLKKNREPPNKTTPKVQKVAMVAPIMKTQTQIEGSQQESKQELSTDVLPSGSRTPSLQKEQHHSPDNHLLDASQSGSGNVGQLNNKQPLIISLVVQGNVSLNTSNIHNPTTRFVCTHCQYCTNVQDDINQHVVDLHQDEDLYMCTLCNKSLYKYETQIVNHCQTTHPSRPDCFRKLPNFYDCEQLEGDRGNFDGRGNIFERMTNLLSPTLTTDVHSGDSSRIQRAKEYMNLQDALKNKTSAEADNNKSGAPQQTKSTLETIDHENISTDSASLTNTIDLTIEINDKEDKLRTDLINDQNNSETCDTVKSPEDLDEIISLDEDECSTPVDDEIISVSVDLSADKDENEFAVNHPDKTSNQITATQIPESQNNNQSSSSLTPTIEPTTIQTVDSYIKPSIEDSNISQLKIVNVVSLQGHSAKKQLTIPQQKTPVSVDDIVMRNERLTCTYKCKTCNVHAHYLSSIIEHLLQYHKSICVYACPYCKMAEGKKTDFKTESDLRHHIARFHPTHFAKKDTSLSDSAKEIVQVVAIPSSLDIQSNRIGKTPAEERDIYMCQKCGAHLPSLDMIYSHIESEHGDVFLHVCPECKKFKHKSDEVVNNHLEQVHHINPSTVDLSLAMEDNLFHRIYSISKNGSYVDRVHSATDKSSTNIHNLLNETIIKSTANVVPNIIRKRPTARKSLKKVNDVYQLRTNFNKNLNTSHSQSPPIPNQRPIIGSQLFNEASSGNSKATTKTIAAFVPVLTADSIPKVQMQQPLGLPQLQVSPHLGPPFQTNLIPEVNKPAPNLCPDKIVNRFPVPISTGRTVAQQLRDRKLSQASEHSSTAVRSNSPSINSVIQQIHERRLQEELNNETESQIGFPAKPNWTKCSTKEASSDDDHPVGTFQYKRFSMTDKINRLGKSGINQMPNARAVLNVPSLEMVRSLARPKSVSRDNVDADMSRYPGILRPPSASTSQGHSVLRSLTQPSLLFPRGLGRNFPITQPQNTDKDDDDNEDDVPPEAFKIFNLKPSKSPVSNIKPPSTPPVPNLMGPFPHLINMPTNIQMPQIPYTSFVQGMTAHGGQAPVSQAFPGFVLLQPQSMQNPHTSNRASPKINNPNQAGTRFECPYCPTLLEYHAVKPHVDHMHHGCAVLYKPLL